MTDYEKLNTSTDLWALWRMWWSLRTGKANMGCGTWYQVAMTRKIGQTNSMEYVEDDHPWLGKRCNGTLSSCDHSYITYQEAKHGRLLWAHCLLLAAGFDLFGFWSIPCLSCKDRHRWRCKEKGVPHVPYRNSKLTHLLQEWVTHMVTLLYVVVCWSSFSIQVLEGLYNHVYLSRYMIIWLYIILYICMYMVEL